ncbi:MAG: RHS repeat domain-containing protein [Nitrospiraceae bacterium]
MAEIMISMHPEYLNTPRLVADATGTTVWRWDQQEPFGANPANDDPDENSVAFDLPLRLPGQRYDAETGLHYNYFRDFAPALGRYVESDPLGRRGGLNGYEYVRSNPLFDLDPTGAVSWRGTFVGISAVKGAGGGVFAFNLLSECKCSKRIRLEGTVVVGGVGWSARFGSSASGVEFYDYHDCPSETIANGLASFGSANVVVLAWGFSCTNDIVLGGLYSRSGCTREVAGLDVSIAAFVGRSWAKATVECCND